MSYDNTPFAAFVIAPVVGGLAATTRAADRGEEGRIGLPGGKLDAGEDAEAAARREAAEEGWEVVGKLVEVRRALYDGRLIVWFLADHAVKLAEYKEIGRITPVVASVRQVASSGYDNAFISALF